MMRCPADRSRAELYSNRSGVMSPGCCSLFAQFGVTHGRLPQNFALGDHQRRITCKSVSPGHSFWEDTGAFSVSDSKVVIDTDFGSRDSSGLNNSAICGFFFSLLQLSAM